MSNAYDDWKTESPDDYYDRMNRYRTRDEEPAGAVSGVCACGAETERTVPRPGGSRYECKRCMEIEMRRQYERRMRTA